MKTHKIAVLSGDGIGPEVVSETIKVLKVVEQIFKYNFEFEEALIGAITIDETGNPLPDATLQLCKDADAVLFGSVEIQNMTIIRTLKFVPNKVC